MRVFSLFFMLVMVFSTIPPQTVVAQSNEDDDVVPAAIRTQNPDIGNYTAYAQVSSTRTGAEGVLIDWVTAYENGNSGFNIVVADGDDLIAVNDELIPSKVIDSFSPQNYSVTVTVPGSKFYIQHVTVNDERYSTGPFIVGETVGEVVEPVKTDWTAIRAESDALARKREAVRVVEINEMLDIVRGPVPSPDEQLIEQSAGSVGERSVFLPLVVGSDNGIQAAGADAIDAVPGVAVNLLVEEEGVYRVTYDDIAATGIDFSGVPSTYMAVTNQGEPVRIRMVAASNWGPGAYFEFIGEGIETLYTKQNVYVLQIDRSKAFRTYLNLQEPDMGEAAADTYVESMPYEVNWGWFSSSPIDDPWVWAMFNRTGSTAVSQTFNFDGVTALEPSSATQLYLEVWGYESGNHIMQVELNGTRLLPDATYSGETVGNVTLDIPASILQNGANTLKLTVPANASIASDAQILEGFTLHYPRQFTAMNGELNFAGSAKRFIISNLPSNNVSVYSVYGNRIWRHVVTPITAANGDYSVVTYGWNNEAQYYVVDAGSVKTPFIQAGQLLITDITSGSYDYLIISHPDFISAIEPLKVRRIQEGYSVKIVDVMDVYAQFGHGMFGIEPIRMYLKHAIQNMNVEYVLLVGDDTYDYSDYDGDNAPSFIPSLYTEILTLTYVPSDPLLTDIDKDGVPDAKVGRFPVTTVQEATLMVNKTLNYTPNGPEPLAGESQKFASIFAAGTGFGSISQGFIDTLPPETWGSIAETAFLDDLSATVALDKLVAAINDGTTLVNFLGHGVLRKWSGLLTVPTAISLTNAGKPAVFLQWACYISFYVHDDVQTISEVLLLSGDQGAVVAFGSTGTILLSSARVMALYTLPKIVEPGKTIGAAIQEAKLATIAEFGYIREDAIYGLNLLGDPTLVVIP